MTPMATREPARRCAGVMSVAWPTGASSGNQRTHSSLKASKSDASRSDQLAHTTLSSELPCSARRACRFWRHCRVCSRIDVPTMRPFSGSTGPIEDT